MIKIMDLRSGADNSLYEKLISRSQMDMEPVLNTVNEIVTNVRLKGDRSVIEYTAKFDKVQLTSDTLKVSGEEIKKAYEMIDENLLNVIKRAKSNIEAFHEKQKEKSWITTENDGVILGQLYRALETVGVYVPGGTAPLPSTVLMDVIPAKVAGVENIILCTPPGADGKVNPVILAAANEAGVTEIYKVGGAQAIAAMAFGTETIPKVDKIVGPGNVYVNTAKRMVFGFCDIDMFAGPSEIAIIADDSADAKYIAADLLSQAEHDRLSSSVLVTISEKLAMEVQNEIEKQNAVLPRKDISTQSINEYGAIIIVGSIDEAVDIVNTIAPEHLEVCVENAFDLIGSIKNAGAIFLGNYSSEPLGDYFAGPNHTLPTSGTARFFSPLNVNDFIKKTSLISYTKNALEKVKNDVILFAETEGLKAHANAIRVRFE